ncbi:hypothetical protein EJB05_39899, partial [Eragrostis curvula]
MGRSKKKKPGGRHDSRTGRGSASRAESGSSSAGAASGDRTEGASSSAGAESGGDSSGSRGRRKREDVGDKGKRIVKPKSDSDESPPPNSDHVSEQAPDLEVAHGLQGIADSMPPDQHASAPCTGSENREQECHSAPGTASKDRDSSKNDAHGTISEADSSKVDAGQFPVTDESLEHDFISFLKMQSLCFPAFKKFMVDSGYGHEVLRQDDFVLYRFPKSIVFLADLLADKSKLVATMAKILGMQHVSVRVLTNLTIALFSGFLAEIWDKHRKGLSWNGSYLINKMVVINGCEYRIMEKPRDYEALDSTNPEGPFKIPKNHDPFAKARVNDVKGLEKIFTPKLRANESDEDTASNLPVLYFSLQQDLKTMTETDVKNPKFWLYLFNHPVFKDPIIRHNLVCNLHLLCTEFHLLPIAIQDILNGPGQDDDWRKHARKSDAPVLHNVYWYDPTNPHNQRKGEVPSTETTKEPDHYPQGEVKVVKIENSKDPFENTMMGQLEYERHYLNHAHRSVPGYSILEQEVFFSSRFFYLPILLKLLVKLGALTEGQNKSKISDDGQKTNLCEAWMPYSLYQQQNVDRDAE